MPVTSPSLPSIDVTAEARQTLLDHLSRAGEAQLVRVHVGHG
ncbi:MAG TPA: hypothetical protein VLT47_13440 [Anaeromyxobacteraceae bacterium]|nr:hypothetical protein [Anaeromyxobacteraceae bacterium]